MQIVRSSKYRHVFGEVPKREYCFENLKVALNAADPGIIKANEKFIAVNWKTVGAGAFCVLPVDQTGILPEHMPLFRGHTAPVTQTEFSPFDTNLIVSGSEDATINVYRFSDDDLFRGDIEKCRDVLPIASLFGHAKKIRILLYHHLADNILLSADHDEKICLWNISSQQRALTLQSNGLVDSMSLDYSGKMLATTTRNKRIQIWDIRANTVVHEAAGHAGSKPCKAVFLDDCTKLASAGFSRESVRQLALWDTRKLDSGPSSGFMYTDSGSGVVQPFYDRDTHLLYLAGKGDGNIRYYEYQDDKLFFLSEFSSIDPQGGIAFMPKRGVDVRKNEIARMYKVVGETEIKPIRFFVPRKVNVFQGDVFPPTLAGKAVISGEDWLAKKDADPIVVSLDSGNIIDIKKPDTSVENSKVMAESDSNKNVIGNAPKKLPEKEMREIASSDAEVITETSENKQIPSVTSPHTSESDVNPAFSKKLEASAKLLLERTLPTSISLDAMELARKVPNESTAQPVTATVTEPATAIKPSAQPVSAAMAEPSADPTTDLAADPSSEPSTAPKSSSATVSQTNTTRLTLPKDLTMKDGAATSSATTIVDYPNKHPIEEMKQWFMKELSIRDEKIDKLEHLLKMTIAAQSEKK